MNESEPLRPGCLLILVQASASMTRERLSLVRLHIDEIIDLLLRRFAPTPELARQFKIGVIGYSQTAKTRIAFTPLLPGASRETMLLPLSELTDGSRRQVKLDLLHPTGNARPSAGLNHAHLMLHHWLAHHPGAYPPLVLHWGDGHGCGSAYARACRSLRLLGSVAGATGVAQYVNRPEQEKFLGRPKTALSRGWRQIWRRSSPVLLPRKKKSAKLARALAINSNPLILVRALLKQARPVHVDITSPASVQLRTLTLPRQGHTPEQLEDALACDPGRGLAAISDGASEGIFVRDWAQLLTKSFLATELDVADPRRMGAWLQACRTAWLKRIDNPALRESRSEKEQGTGAGATFLAWQAGTDPKGDLIWRAWAVGDSCLFWVRNNRLRATFPMTHSRHFGFPPNLLATRPDVDVPAPLFAAARCRPGDLFLLATDAFAQYLLRAAEQKREPDWNALENMEEHTWRKRVAALRGRNRIVDDDCTVVFARIN